VAVPHPKAGTILLPKKFTTSGAFAPGLVFGPQLNGFAAPAVSLAPPLPVRYLLPNPAGARYGQMQVMAPPAPPDYTAVRYGDTVAFVPTKLDAAAPEDPPAGYVPFKHPTAGLTFVPAKYVHDGVRSADASFGAAAAGMAAPAVPLAQGYAFN